MCEQGEPGVWGKNCGGVFAFPPCTVPHVCWHDTFMLLCLCLHLLCSTALHTTSIWSNTIGLQQDQAGTNSAIEASIYAPGGGGRNREAKRQRAQELIEASKCSTASDWVAECQNHLNVMKATRQACSGASNPIVGCTSALTTVESRNSCPRHPQHLQGVSC